MSSQEVTVGRYGSLPPNTPILSCPLYGLLSMSILAFLRLGIGPQLPRQEFV